MGMCASGDIFQAKLDYLLGDSECIKTYIENILVLIKESFSEHIEQPRIVFSILCAAGLKFNSPKCSFGLNYIPYLGYLITQEGIKYYPDKLQGIIDTGRPTTTNEAQAITSMVKYYRDMWPRQSHILAPMKYMASGPKGRKIIWNDALEDPFK